MHFADDPAILRIIPHHAVCHVYLIAQTSAVYARYSSEEQTGGESIEGDIGPGHTGCGEAEREVPPDAPTLTSAASNAESRHQEVGS
jgi:hypothetical protein